MSESLDALAERFPNHLRCRIEGEHISSRGRIIGYAWSFPRKTGGPPEAALVIQFSTGRIGHAYPDEITPIERTPPTVSWWRTS